MQNLADTSYVQSLRPLGRGHTILTLRKLTSCEAAHTHIVISRYLMWAFGARQSGRYHSSRNGFSV